MTMHPSESLQAALVHTGMEAHELWLGYLALGGTATEPEVAAYVAGRAGPPFDDTQHDTLVHVLNERFTEMDLDHPLPYHRH